MYANKFQLSKTRSQVFGVHTCKDDDMKVKCREGWLSPVLRGAAVGSWRGCPQETDKSRSPLPSAAEGPEGRGRLTDIYSKLPYIATASSMVISPFPTLNAAIRSWTVSGSVMPIISGEMVRSAGTWPKGA